MSNTRAPLPLLASPGAAEAAAVTGGSHRPGSMQGPARLQLEPSMRTTRLNREEEKELLSTTVVVSSPKLLSREMSETVGRSNIHLQEEVFLQYPSAPAPDLFLSPPPERTNDKGSSPPWPQRKNWGSKHAFDNNQEFERLGASSLAVVNAQYQLPDVRAYPFGGMPPRSTRQISLQHEYDHDSCPFTAVRRSEWTLKHAANIPRTSPLSLAHILSSFSIKNAFMFYPPPPTYCFVCDDQGSVEVRSQSGKREPRLDEDRIEHVRHQRRLSRTVPDDLVAGALHGIASSSPPCSGQVDETGACAEPSFEMVFIPSEYTLQAYVIQSGSIVFGQKVRMGGPRICLGGLCPIPCSIIRPHRRMSSHVCLFFHCNGEDIGRPSCLRLLTLANVLHMTILVPEYPGYGLYPGSPSEASLKGAMESVIEFLFATDPSLTPSRVILMGHSIGTGVAVHVARYMTETFLRLRSLPQLQELLPYACPAQCSWDDRSDERESTTRCQYGYPEAKVEQNVAPPVVLHHPIKGAGAPSSPAPTSFRAPFGGPFKAAAGLMNGLPCRHYALGGIILLAPFASVRSVEQWAVLQDYGLNVQELERRRLQLPHDTLVAAPQEWSADASDVDASGESLPSMDFLRRPPLLFSIARYISFNRFPSIDVVCDLQEQQDFFRHTPLLLIHGTRDVLVPPLHSVAIATKLRQCTNGASAMIYLGQLEGEGHNNLHCSHLIRRFYKDAILLPHLRRQTALRAEMEETLGGQARREKRSSSAPASAGATARVPDTSVQAEPIWEGFQWRPHQPPFLPTASRTTQNGIDRENQDRNQPAKTRMSQQTTGALSSPLKTSYLYFIEPAAELSREGDVDGPMRVRLLHPPDTPRSEHLDRPTPMQPETAAAPEDSPVALTEKDTEGQPTRIETPSRVPHDASPSSHLNAPTQTKEGSDPEGRPPCGTGAGQARRMPVTEEDNMEKLPPNDIFLHATDAQPEAFSSVTTAGFETSLRDALRHTQPPHLHFAPAATLMHIALFPQLDHYDVGSIAVAAVRQNAVGVTQALQQWRRYRRNTLIARWLTAAVYFILGFFIIGLGVVHAVLTLPSHLPEDRLPVGTAAHDFRSDPRVILWGVLGGVAYEMLGVVRFYQHRLDIGNLSKHFHTPRVLVLLYCTVLITAYALCTGIGILMALVIAFAPSHRGGVPWDRWEDLPYTHRVWISCLPRWTMVASAVLQLTVAAILILKNH